MVHTYHLRMSEFDLSLKPMYIVFRTLSWIIISINTNNLSSFSFHCGVWSLCFFRARDYLHKGFGSLVSSVLETTRTRASFCLILSLVGHIWSASRHVYHQWRVLGGLPWRHSHARPIYMIYWCFRDHSQVFPVFLRPPSNQVSYRYLQASPLSTWLVFLSPPSTSRPSL